MAFTQYFDWTTGKTLYAKPRPLTTGPWDGDVVALTENIFGEFSSALFADSTDYTIFERLTGAELATDPKIGSLNATHSLPSQFSPAEKSKLITVTNLGAAGAVNSVAIVDNLDGTLSLTFYDLDGVSVLATATFTPITGVRSRIS